MPVHEIILLREIIYMERATEKGLMISFIGFFAQVFFQFISLSYMQYLCCLQFTDLVILVGILLIYIGRFEFSQKHQDMAKYSIILFIVVQIGIFILPFVVSSPEIIAASSGLKIALVFLINMMLAYHLISEKNRNILKGALVLGIIGAGIFSYLITPVLLDDEEIDEELEVLLGEDETYDVLLSPSTAKDDFKEEIIVSENNITACFDNISDNYDKWHTNISNLKIDGGKYFVATSTHYPYLAFTRESATVENVTSLEVSVVGIEGELGLLDLEEPDISGMYNQTGELLDIITVNLGWIREKELDIENKSAAIGLIEERLDNIMKQNKFKLVIVLPTLMFGFIYFQTHKMIKEDLNRKEEERKKKILSETLEEEEGEDDEEEEEEEEYLEISPEKEIKKKKTPPRGKKKGAKIMDLDEIRKKYNK